MSRWELESMVGFYLQMLLRQWSAPRLPP